MSKYASSSGRGSDGVKVGGSGVGVDVGEMVGLNVREGVNVGSGVLVIVAVGDLVGVSERIAVGDGVFVLVGRAVCGGGSAGEVKRSMR